MGTVYLIGTGFPFTQRLQTYTRSARVSGNILDITVTSKVLAGDGGASSDSNFAIKYSWNPFDKSAGVTLSNDDHTATPSTGFEGVRGTIGRSSGKRYFEIFVPTTNHLTQFNVYGMAKGSYDLEGGQAYFGSVDFRGIILGIYGGGGHFTMNNNTMRFAVDFANREINVALNNGSWLGPIRFNAGEWFPAAAFQSNPSSISATVNMGDSPFSYPVPAGFVAWNGEQIAGSDGDNVINSIIVSAGQIDNETQTIMHTVDGVTWTPAEPDALSVSGHGISFSALAHSTELNLFVGIAPSAPNVNNQIATSPDGATWTLRTSPQLNSWNSVAWSPELGLFVAVASTGTNRVMTSPDGINWILRTAANNTNWVKVLWSNYHQKFLAAAQTAASGFMYSSDGINWTLTSADPGVGSAECTAVNETTGRIVQLSAAGIGDNLTYSDDLGATWTTGVGPGHDSWDGLLWNADLNEFYAVGNSFGGGTNPTFISSPDGVTWATRKGWSGQFIWHSLCWSRALQIYIAVGGGTDAYIATSPDGDNWQTQTPTFAGRWDNVIEGVLHHDSPSSELESAIMSDIRREQASSSDKILHDAKSSDDAMSSSDKQFGDAASSSNQEASSQRDQEEASSSAFLAGQASSSDEQLSSEHASDKRDHDAASSSDKPGNDAASSSNEQLSSQLAEDYSSLHEIASSEFQSDQTNAPAPPIQVVVTVTT